MFKPKLFTLVKDYNVSTLLADGVAGLTVGVVALPLAMAFAIASGLPPERGLFTAIVVGFLISFLGGSRVQIGGPTGAFVVIVSGILAQYGYAGLAWCTLMAGGILILFGVFRLGGLIRFIPFPVTTGFTSGIALVIFQRRLRISSACAWKRCPPNSFRNGVPISMSWEPPRLQPPPSDWERC